MNNEGVKIKYGDVAPEAKENFIPSALDKADFVQLSQLQKYNLQFENHANPCEYGAVLLDSSASPFPMNPQNENMGLWSNSVTNSAGTFDTPVVLTLESTGQYSSQGFTLTFDTYNNIFCNSLNIKWYRNDELIDEMDFEPNSAFYFCQNHVQNYNKVIFRFNSLNMTYNRLKLRVIDYGYGTFFTGDELRRVKIIQEINPISSEISINTVDFTLDSKSDMEYSFQSKQPLSIYFNGELKATTFVTSSKRKAKRQWDVNSEDYIGMLDKLTFMGGMYSGKNAAELLESIFNQAKVPYTIEAYFADSLITGYIPICTCREALIQICFAIGAAVDTSCLDKINIRKLSDEVSQIIPLKRIMQGQSFDDEDRVTKVSLTQHSFVQSDEYVDLYKASENGSGSGILVKFSEPCHSLEIRHGAILQSGANFAVIDCDDDACWLRGKKYDDNLSVKSILNPLVSASDLENVIEIADATLISSDNIDSVLQGCYSFLVKTNKVNANIVEGKNRIKYGQAKYGRVKFGEWIYDSTVNVGDIITAKTEYLGDLTGRIISQRYGLNGGIIVKECEIV